MFLIIILLSFEGSDYIEGKYDKYQWGGGKRDPTHHDIWLISNKIKWENELLKEQKGGHVFFDKQRKNDRLLE